LQCSEMGPERNEGILIRASYATDYCIRLKLVGPNFYTVD